MNRQERAKRAVLERSIDDLDAAERRMLADLHRAGYRFQTADRARQHLKALRALDTFKTPDALAEAFIETERRRS